MKDKEEKKETKVKEVNPRSVRRKIKKGTNNVKEDLGKTVVLKKKTVSKEINKIEKKEEKKVDKKEVVEKRPKHTKKLNKIPYVLFTLLSILYFATTLILVGFTSYRTVAMIRANKSDRLDTYVKETLIEDDAIFDKENKVIYNDTLPKNNKVITYYYFVSVGMIIVSLFLAFTFSYLSEMYTDKNFDNPFSKYNLAMLKRSILFVVLALCVSAVSVIFQRALTPFNITTIETGSILIIAISLIVSYMVFVRGNELVKE